MAERLDGVRRFDGRVEDYARYRPDYPHEIITVLRAAGLSQSGRVADVGCGTGKLAEVFLDAGYEVVGIEPNASMRRMARRVLASASKFSALAGRAERLPAADRCFDAIVAGQAFHWFEPAAARAEFERALRKAGIVALVWNNRKAADSGFLAEYEEMLRRLCPDYANIGNKHYEERDLERFFGGSPTHVKVDHAQHLDRAGLHGRLLSSSYVPAAGPQRAAVLEAADGIFMRYAKEGQISIPYDTEVFHGRLAHRGDVRQH